MICLALLTLAVIALPFTIKRVWRGQVAFAGGVPPWWPLSPAGLRGYLRAIPIVSLVGGPGLSIAGWCFILLSSIGGREIVADPTMRGWLTAGALFGGAVTMLGVLLGAAVAFLNRPRRFVPPHLRPGDGR